MLISIGAAILAVTAGAFWYYTSTQDAITALKNNNAALSSAVSLNEQTIASLTADYTRANTQLEQLNKQFAETREQNSLLVDKLAKHNLAVLAYSKPALVEKLINQGTANSARCFELLSGAKLTNKEKEAKNGKSFNNECPWLWDSRRSN